jgi:chloramphenicol 3-O-phosphotransferase
MGEKAEYSPPGVLLLNGMPGAGKTTVARLLAGSSRRGAHIEGDEIHNLVVGGRVHPPGEPEEVRRQLLLRERNMALLADSFYEAGVFPILDNCISTREYLDYLLSRIRSRPIAMVVLAPPMTVALERDRHRAEKTVAHLHMDGYATMHEELSGIGLWLDPQKMAPQPTANEVLRRAFSEGVVCE